MKQVYEFKEGGKEMIPILGGKGGNLSEMVKIGLPIPYGIIVSTTACNQYFKDGEKLSESLKEEILKNIQILENATGKKIQSENPLLVSVRSGAPVSMPGMMDTILNLGFNDYVAQKMLDITGDEEFVYSSYLRFVQMFSEITEGIDRKRFTELKADNYKDQINEGKQIYKNECGKEFPENFEEQIFYAVKAIFDSWNNDRAILYRKLNNIDNNMGTAVIIQEMVFGNLNEKSGTGVLFTRNPSTGEDKIFGEVLLNAQGEDIVAGIRTPDDINLLKTTMPVIYDELVKTTKKLEKHNKDMQDIEFTIENSKLFILQTRNGKRAPEASLKIAMDMVEENILTKEEAVLKVEPSSINKLLTGDFDEKSLKEAVFLTKGLAASSGVAVGRIMFDSKRVKIREKTILIREETSPEDLQGMALAQGIVTLKGGATSHGAVVARGMGKCCVTGCSEIKIDEIKRTMTVGEHVLKEGDFISVSGHTGEIFLGKIPLKENSFLEKVAFAFETVSQNDFLVTLGIQPTRPDTGYGYIQFSKEEAGEINKVKTFTEKPNLETAEKFLASGQYLWNAGIFIWNAKSILKAFENHLPEMAQQFVSPVYNTPEEKDFVENIYPQTEKISIDNGILEKADNVYVIPADLGWSDLGTWTSVFENAQRDDNQNLKSDNSLIYNTKGSVIRIKNKNKIAVIDGLEDYIIVDTEKALLICPRKHDQLIKQYVADLQDLENGKEFI